MVINDNTYEPKWANFQIEGNERKKRVKTWKNEKKWKSVLKMNKNEWEKKKWEKMKKWKKMSTGQPVIWNDNKH